MHHARTLTSALLLLALLWLAGCAGGPPHEGVPALPATAAPGRDGAEAHPPPELERVPDAEPRLEPIRPGGPNKPYEVLGRSYVPITQDAPFTERGLASWYGKKFHGRRTASGELYNMYAMTAAHRTLPIPSYARVRNPANGREVVVRINDRGPFRSDRIIDLSYTAALKLGVLRGVAPVELQRITGEDIRSGAWKRDADAPATSEAAAKLVVASTEATSAAQPASAAAETVTARDEPAGAALPSAAAAPVEDAPPARADTAPARGFWVQLGAFKLRVGAETFQQRVAAELDWIAPLLAVFNDGSAFRLQAGPYRSRDAARGAAERVRDGLKLVPVIVERR